MVVTSGKIKRNLASPKRCRDNRETSTSNRLAMLARIAPELPVSTVMTKARARSSYASILRLRWATMTTVCGDALGTMSPAAAEAVRCVAVDSCEAAADETFKRRASK